MPAYKAPLRDIRFLMNEVFDYPAHYQTLTSGQNADADTVDMILEGAADYCENVLSPINQSGDEEGCTFNNGEVTTPKGFKEAYDQFVMGGWQGLSYPEEFGGQGLPMSLNLIKSEMMGTANWSFTMYPGLSTGCMNTIMQFGTDEQKNTYMPKLVEGTWSGTMCLTEPQCGTDLGQVKTKAEPAADGAAGAAVAMAAGPISTPAARTQRHGAQPYSRTECQEPGAGDRGARAPSVAAEAGIPGHPRRVDRPVESARCSCGTDAPGTQRADRACRADRRGPFQALQRRSRP